VQGGCGVKKTTKFNPEKDMIFAEPDKRRYLVVKKRHVKILQPKTPKGIGVVKVKKPSEAKPYFDFKEIEWEESETQE
jgi:hypothetical protein